MTGLECPIEWCDYVAPTIAALELHLRVEHGATSVRHPETP